MDDTEKEWIEMKKMGCRFAAFLFAGVCGYQLCR